MKANQLVIALFSVLVLSACGSDYTPKPKGYFKIEFPTKTYRQANPPCPFVFEIPQYAFWSQDSSHNAEPCWINVDYPGYRATLHMTYKAIGDGFNFQDLQNDSRTLVYKHTIKAQEIFENPIHKPDDNVHGMLYQLTGDAATSLQFYVTDSTTHYLRGVLYFNTHTNEDSIAPVLDYLSKDVMEVIGSLKWKGQSTSDTTKVLPPTKTKSDA